MSIHHHFQKILGLKRFPENIVEIVTCARNEIEELFTSDGHTGAEDPLIEIVRRFQQRDDTMQREGRRENSLAASSFMQSVMLFHGLACSVVVFTCCIALASEWHAGALLMWPLRLWLCVYGASQFLQAPVRLVLLSKLRQCDRDGSSLEACVAKFTGSPVWIFSARLSTLLYLWYAVGILWLLQSQSHIDESTSQSYHRMVRYAILQAFVRTVGVLCVSAWVLPPAPQIESTVPKVCGMSQQDIADVPVVEYIPGQQQETCTICLSDFAEGDRLRSLSCSHQYHQKCLDEWLRRCNRCPLCMRSVCCTHFSE